MLDQNVLKQIHQKLAAADKPQYDLPGGEWYKGLLASLSAHQAGRAQVLSETDPKHVKKPSFNVKHPYWSSLAAGLGGAAVGGGAGFAAGHALAPDDTVPLDDLGVKVPPGAGYMHNVPFSVVSAAIGSGLGAGIAGLALAIQRQREVAEMSSQFTEPDPELLQQSAEKDAKRSALWQMLRSVLVGEAEAGRGSQMSALKNKGSKVKSGYIAGLQVPAGLAYQALKFAPPPVSVPLRLTTSGMGLGANVGLGLHGRAQARQVANG